MADTEVFKEQLAVTIVETVLIGAVSLVGFLCNFLSFLVLIRHKAFKNSFGYLAAYEAFSNACILLIFSLWTTPWTLLEIPISLHRLNLIIGGMSLLFAESSFHCSLLITINRFLAVVFPLFYWSVFSERVTQILLVIVSLISVAYFGVYFVDGCDFYYDHQYSLWTFGVEPCSQNLAFYVDMSYNVSIFVLISGIDAIVLVNLRAATKKIMAANGADAKEQCKKRHRKETRLFLQSFLTSCTYSFMQVCFHVIGRWVPDGFGLFMCTTFIWGFSHTVAGVILIYFNPEIRRHILGIRPLSKFLKDPTSMFFIRPMQTMPQTMQSTLSPG